MQAAIMRITAAYYIVYEADSINACIIINSFRVSAILYATDNISILLNNGQRTQQLPYGKFV